MSRYVAAPEIQLDVVLGHTRSDPGSACGPAGRNWVRLRPMAVWTSPRTYPADIRRSNFIWKNVKIAVKAQYIAAAMISASSFLRSWFPISCARRKRSACSRMTPRNATSAVSFIRAMKSLPVGGMMTRVAWGRTTRRIRCAYDIPSASAASACPCPTDWIPARKISVM